VTLTFDLLTLEPAQNASRSTDNLPVTFGVSRHFVVELRADVCKTCIRLLQDRVCTYEILSTELNTNHALLTRVHCLMYVDAENFLTVNSSSQMRGHMYKLYKP